MATFTVVIEGITDAVAIYHAIMGLALDDEGTIEDQGMYDIAQVLGKQIEDAFIQEVTP